MTTTEKQRTGEPVTTPARGRNAPAYLVAEREVRARLADKVFLGSVAFTLLMLVAVFAITAVVGGRDDGREVAVVSTQGAEVVRAAAAADGPDGADLRPLELADPGTAEQAVRDGEADAALLPVEEGFEVVGDEEVAPELSGALGAAVAQQALERNAAEAGVTLDQLTEGSALTPRLLDPDAADADARSLVAFAFAFIFLLTAITFGTTISQSVVAEKESRVVEILVAAVPVRALLWGKIGGNTLLALGQVLLTSVVGVGGLYLTGRGDLLGDVGAAMAAYVAFFVLGFLALACLWSVGGALASRQEDLQATTLPGQALLFIPYFVSLVAGEKVQTVMSMLPIVSAMVMPGRMAETAVPWWQIAVAVGATVLATLALVRVSARLYERTVLRTGTRTTYRQALALTGDGR